MKLDEKILGQLQQIKNMDSAMSWLASRLEDRKDGLIYLSGEHLIRAQGRTAELKELLAEIRDSSETLIKMRK